MKPAVYFLFLLFVLVCFPVMGVEVADTEEPMIENFTDATSESAVMRPFSDCPVSYSTGTASITIPLVSMSTAYCGVSLGLHYRCEAKKVNQYAGMLGLGWNLSGLGSVTRQLSSMPDDWKNSLIDLNVPSDSVKRLEYYNKLLNNKLDSDADRYTVVTPTGEALTFIMIWNKDYKQYDIKKLGYSELEIGREAATDSRKTESFTVTDHDGFMYKYEEKEETRYSYTRPSWTKTIDAFTIVSAWHLTKIITPERNDTIFIEYENGTPWSIEQDTRIKTLSYRWPITEDGKGCRGDEKGETISKGIIKDKVKDSPIYTVNYDKPKLPKNIRAKDYHIEFEYKTKPGYRISVPDQLETVALRDHYGATTHAAHFEYSADTDNRRQLTSIRLASYVKTLEKYKLSYFDDEESPGDIFGYPNGLFFSDYSSSILNEYLQINGSRKIVPANLTRGMLQEVTTSAGLRTIFTYEPAAAQLHGDTGIWDNNLSVGTRIKSIKTLDKSTGRERLREFKYSGDTLNMDIRAFGIDDFLAPSGKCNSNHIDGGYCGFVMSVDFTSTARRAGRSLGSMRVYYDTVEETVSGTGLSSPIKTRYEYDLSLCISTKMQYDSHKPISFNSPRNLYLGYKDSLNPADPGRYRSIFAPHRLTEYFVEEYGGGPMLKAKTVMAYKNGNYTPATSTTYSYRIDKPDTLLVSRHFESLIYQSLNCRGAQLSENNIKWLEHFSTGDVYACSRHFVCKGSKTTRHYPDGKERTISKDYVYEPLIIEKEINSEIVNAPKVRRLRRLRGFLEDSILISEMYRPRGVTYSFSGDSISEVYIYNTDVQSKFFNSIWKPKYLPLAKKTFVHGADYCDSIHTQYFYTKDKQTVRPIMQTVRRHGALIDSVRYAGCLTPTDYPEFVSQRDGTTVKYRWSPYGEMWSKEIVGSDIIYEYSYENFVGCYSIKYPTWRMRFFNYDNTRLSEIRNNNDDVIESYTYSNYEEDGENSVTATTATAGGEATRRTVFDGFGLPTQRIAIGFGGDDGDVVGETEYDALDRAVKEWQPRPLAESAADFYGDSRAFTENIYDADGSDNIIAATAPGKDMNGHPTTAEYTCNTASGELCCRRLTVKGDRLICNGVYPDAYLDVVRATDGDGHKTLTFTDWRGRTILTRKVLSAKQFIDTYTLYDHFDNVVLILQPMGADALKDGSYDISDGNMDQLIERYAYVYRYDDALRQVYAKMPGVDPVTTVYDPDGLVAYTVDGNLRGKGKCRFTLYDDIARPVVTGICDEPSVTPRMRAVFDGDAIGIDSTGYVPASTLPAMEIHTVTYYDRYYNLRHIEDIPSDLIDEYEWPTGLVTCTLERVMGSSPARYAATVIKYDLEDRPYSTLRTFHSPGVCLITDNEYNIDGSVSTSVNRLIHPDGGHTDSHAYTYDSSGRLTQETVSYDGGDPIVLQQPTYNRIGTPESNFTGAFTDNYTYNVRGSLTKQTSEVFSQTTSYSEKYNGSVAGVFDKITGGASISSSYFYDNADRLSSASIFVNGTTRPSSYQYDLNGNMTYLSRMSNVGSSMVQDIDKLNYTYNGNRVVKIDDTAPTMISESTMNFIDGADEDIEYTYDANGNTTYDANRDVRYRWDSNNMLSTAAFDQGVVEFTHSASGTLLQRAYAPYRYLLEVSDSIPTLKPRPFSAASLIGSGSGLKPWNPGMDFLVCDYYNHYGHYEYTNDRFNRVNTSTGYIDSIGVHTFVRDRQGNIRAVVRSENSAPVIEQETYYYPYGMPMPESTNPTANQYKYTGKELITDRGLNLYDYGARFYDPTTTLWNAVDNYSEIYHDMSHYVFCANNPINIIDPDGNGWIHNNTDNKYIWDEKVTDASLAPDGWEYVGEDNNCILRHMGLSQNIYTMEDSYFIGAGGNYEEGGSTYNNGLFGTDVYLVFSVYEVNKIFKGIILQILENYRNISTGDFELYPATYIAFDYGGKRNEFPFHKPNHEVVTSTNYIPREETIFFSAKLLQKYPIPDTFYYSGGWNYRTPWGGGAVGWLGIFGIIPRFLSEPIHVKK